MPISRERGLLTSERHFSFVTRCWQEVAYCFQNRASRCYEGEETKGTNQSRVFSELKGVAVSADSSTDLARLESTFLRLLSALQSFAPVASWVNNAHERSQCESAYHELCGLAAELDLPRVPSIDFPPVDGRAAGLAIGRWECEAFGCLKGRSRKTDGGQRRSRTGRPNKHGKRLGHEGNRRALRAPRL
jgi:hypothetical protein